MIPSQVRARLERDCWKSFVTEFNGAPSAARSGISHAVHWASDYAILLFSFVLTAIVFAGVQHIGPKHLGPRSIELKDLLPVPVVEIAEFAPPPPPAPVVPVQLQVPPPAEHETGMRPSALIARWNPFVAEASRRFGLSADWIRAVMRVESGGRTTLDDKPITSHAGAVGIMQMMPQTYRAMSAEYRLGANPFNPHDNVIAATAYLRTLYKKYGFPNMFAAYNGGPGKLQDHLETGAPLPKETQNYVASITHILGAKGAEETAHVAEAAPHRPARVAEAAPRRHGRRFEATLRG
jgi:hypothetical protein